MLIALLLALFAPPTGPVGADSIVGTWLSPSESKWCVTVKPLTDVSYGFRSRSMGQLTAPVWKERLRWTARTPIPASAPGRFST